MAPDLITLTTICHEESVHLVNPPKLHRQQFGIETKQPQVIVSECEIDLSASDNMANSNDARKRSLVTMYSTGFVFNQNQKHLVKSLPWSGPKSVKQNPALSSEDMQKMAKVWVSGRGNGRKTVGDKQVQSLQSEKLRAEHAASMFALLT